MPYLVLAFVLVALGAGALHQHQVNADYLPPSKSPTLTVTVDGFDPTTNAILKADLESSFAPYTTQLSTELTNNEYAPAFQDLLLGLNAAELIGPTVITAGDESSPTPAQSPTPIRKYGKLPPGWDPFPPLTGRPTLEPDILPKKAVNPPDFSFYVPGIGYVTVGGGGIKIGPVTLFPKSNGTVTTLPIVGGTVHLGKGWGLTGQVGANGSVGLGLHKGL